MGFGLAASPVEALLDDIGSIFRNGLPQPVFEISNALIASGRAGDASGSEKNGLIISVFGPPGRVEQTASDLADELRKELPEKKIRLYGSQVTIYDCVKRF